MVIGVFPNMFAVHSFFRTMFSTKTPKEKRMPYVACKSFSWNPDTGELNAKYEPGEMTEAQLAYRHHEHYRNSKNGYDMVVGRTDDRPGDYVWTMYLNAEGIMFNHDSYHQHV